MSQSMMVGQTKVTVFSPPPNGFNALEANDRELLVHGFPSRPDKQKFPAIYERWHKVVSRPLNHIVPTFEVNLRVQHAPVRKKRAVQDAAITENWAGATASPVDPGDTMKWIAGSWTTALSYPPSGAADGITFHHSTWIGIDGISSPDLVQVGVHQTVTSHKGLPTNRLSYVWWDWVPGFETVVSNFTVSPGDSLNALLCTLSPTEVSIFLTNENSLDATSFVLSAPPRGTLVGGSAEWIVETPLVDGAFAPLARFNEIFFEDTFAVALNEGVFTAPGGVLLAMENSTGAILANAAPDGPNILKVTSRD